MGIPDCVFFLFLLTGAHGFSLDKREETENGHQLEEIIDAIKRSEECLSICPQNVSVPNCGDLRMAPDYEKNCDCLLGYKCCPKKCKKPVVTCAKGTYPVTAKDCCDCDTTKCVACPKVEHPPCNRTECEAIEYETTDIGCLVPTCKTRCPTLVDPICPTCFTVETFINGSLCGCEQQRCVKKTCSAPEKLKAADYPCHVILQKHDNCGCKINKPEKGPYCKPINEKAKNAVCTDDKLPDKCLVNIVNKKTDKCGCDTNECARKDEAVVNEYESKDCPKGHLMAKGLTPCGKPRHACVKCPEIDVDEKNCNKKCNKILSSTDFHGCPVKTCKKNACPKCFGFVSFAEDDCGCGICQALTMRGDILVQKRSNVDSKNFDKDWNSYENGFSLDSKNYWLGLRNMYEIASVQHKGKCELVLEGKRGDDGKWMKVVLSGFSLGSAEENYKLNFDDVIERSGTNIHKSYVEAHRGMSFTTKDRDNDKWDGNNCASGANGGNVGGWWYGREVTAFCQHLCLNCNQWQWYESNWIPLSETRMWIRIKT